MRDILLTAIIAVLLVYVLRNARVGAYLWAWLSLANPHRQTFGFARQLPFAYLAAIFTLVSLLNPKNRRPFPVTGITVVQILFLFWMTVTSVFALDAWDAVQDRWIFVMKIHLMIFVTMMLIRGREQIVQLVWVVALSVGFYGVKGGIFTLLTGGGQRVWGPAGSLLEGNNELGVALVMIVPLLYFMYQTVAQRWLKWGMIFCFLTCCMAILGTQSRGALLALLAMAAVLGFKGKRPVLTTAMLGLLVVLAIAFMPDSWTTRMDSIQDFRQDESAMARLYTWQTLWNLALDRPLVGAGFGTDKPMIYALYGPAQVGGYTFGRVYVAHSIYFQALGEHGFPGLFLYLLLGVTTWRTANRIARQTKDDPEFSTWVPLLMRAVQVSLAGFAVGGAFLTLVHLDLTYYFVCFVVLVDATLKERVASAQSQGPATEKIGGGGVGRSGKRV